MLIFIKAKWMKSFSCGVQGLFLLNDEGCMVHLVGLGKSSISYIFQPSGYLLACHLVGCLYDFIGANPSYLNLNQ